MFPIVRVWKTTMLICLLISCIEVDIKAQSNDHSSLEELLERQERQVVVVTLAALVPVIVLFIFGFFFYYRIRREAQFRERELELKYAKSEMEMRALRAQVNPHFIFNSLSSIQHAIHNKNTQQAENHLVKFSRLIRQVLEHSSSSFISLREDVKILELYMDLEILRLDGLFSYEITFEDGIDQDELFVPPLLLQPLIENAIWHGLTNRTTADGKLTIRFKDVEGTLMCYITDNGVKNIEQSNHNSTSHGLRMIEERVKLHSHKSNSKVLELEELKNSTGYAGMQVKVVMPVETNE